MRNFGLFISLFSLLLASCGKDGGDGTLPIPKRQIDKLSEQTSEYINDPTYQPKNGKTSVKMPERTPYGLTAVMTSKTSYGLPLVQTCTGFLINSNTVITNSHCVSEEIKKKPSLCSKKMAFGVQTKNGTVNAFCKKLIYASPIKSFDFSAPDYAVIEIDQNIDEESTFTVSRGGIDQEEKLFIATLNVAATRDGVFGFKATFEKKDCQAKKDSILGVHVNKMSSIIPLFSATETNKGCPLKPGQTGSPVVNQDGKVVGLAFAGKNRKTDLSLVDDELRNQLSGLMDFTLVTNLKCLKLHRKMIDSSIDKECADFLKNEKASMEEYLKNTLKVDENLIKEKIEKMKEGLPSIFKYDVQFVPKNELEYTVVPFPICVEKTKKWSQEYQDQIEVEGKIFKKKSFKLNLSTIEIVNLVKTNEFGQLYLENTVDFGNEYQVELPRLKKLFLKKTILHNPLFQDSNYPAQASETETMEYKMPWCKKNTEKNWDKKKAKDAENVEPNPLENILESL